MRVVHAFYLSERPGRNPFSGAENHLWVLLPALVKDGITVELIVLELHGGPALDAKYAQLRNAGVEVQVVKRALFSNPISKVAATLAMFASVFMLLRRRSSAVLHLHLDDIYLPVLSMFAGCKDAVFSFHCDEPRYRTSFYKFWYRTVGRRFKRFIGISQHVAQYCQTELGLPAEKVKVVYYGIPAPPQRQVVREQFGISPDKFIAGFVGRLTEQKNLRTFCEAAGGLPGLEAVLVGAGPEEESLRRFVAERNLGNIKFLGAQPDAATLMPLFDLLCLPSRWEGLGLVLVEAMLQCVPVLGSTAGAIPEILDGGRFGTLVDCQLAESLREALADSIPRRAELMKTARAQRQAVAERFSVPSMIQSTVAVYRSLRA